ncbi:hypothetical protein LCGC14_0536040 [marine sediment metagenome]|uniref:Uncharacterized protein n=1 Tax=marine sediment metagenome TaxID=412755 RepID=A0A0F9SCK2_9ZZZZ
MPSYGRTLIKRPLEELFKRMQTLSSDEHNLDALVLANEIRVNYTVTEIAMELNISEARVKRLMKQSSATGHGSRRVRRV